LTAAFWSLNLAEQAGASPELAQALGGCCITTGSIPLHRWAERYRQLALAAAHSANDPVSEAYVLELAGLYQIGVGRWAEAEAVLEQASAIYAKLELRRSETEALSLLAKAHYFQGQFSQAWQTHTAGLIVSQKQGDPAGEHWNLLGLSECALHTGQATIADIGSWLERAEAVQHTRSLARADLIRYYGMLALAQLHRGEYRHAAETARVGANLITRNSLAGVWTMEGFAGVAETYLALWEAAHDDQRTRVEPEALAMSARIGCNALRAFARIFPIAQPRAWLCQGWYNWLAGNPARADRAWQRSLQSAQQLAMPYEQARAHYELGRHATRDVQRQTHLQSACDGFARLGAMTDQARAAHALSGLPD
jgi:hypothetical protein